MLFNDQGQAVDRLAKIHRVAVQVNGRCVNKHLHDSNPGHSASQAGLIFGEICRRAFL